MFQVTKILRFDHIPTMASNHGGSGRPLSDSHHHSGSSDRLADDKTAQCTVTCVYQAKIVGMFRNVTVVWCKNLINHSLHITVDSPGDDRHYICKIDFKPWHFWSKKGYKLFEVEEKRVDIYWDLRTAKFSGSPEPYMDYYVALVDDEEVALLIGDIKKKAYKRTKSRPSLIDAILVYKKEHVFGKKCFSTRVKFDQRKDNDIVVESLLLGPRDPEMWISIDGIILVHVTNLQWKFRGNATVQVNKMPVQVFWDVHDWLFSAPGAGHGLFIFKPGAPEHRIEHDRSEGGSNRGETDSNSTDEGVVIPNSPSIPDFSLFLYAWKLE